MLTYQVGYLICTDTTDPDRINDLCGSAAIPTLNLDLPGDKALSDASDKYAFTFQLTQKILSGT
jgi:LacI family fructose operon transcriptional repressor